MTTDWSIWALEYARSNMPKDFFGGTLTHSNEGRVRNPMLYSVVMGGAVGEAAKPIVIDTGMKGDFSPSGKSYENVEAPSVTLAKIGLAPEDIETVVLTHLHFDHAGNLDQFPNAKFLVQRSEYDGWKQVLAEPGDPRGRDRKWAMSSLNPADFEVLDALIADGRVTFLDGDEEIAPGLTCRLETDSHTFGSQWVEVQTPEGPFVVAGDCVYWYANVEELWPPGYIQGNAWRLIETYRRVLGLLDGEVNRIVPGHEPEVFVRHPSWTAGHHPVAEIRLAASDASRVVPPT